MEMTKDDLQQIAKVLKDIDFLQHLSPAESEKLIAGFEKSTMKKGDTLIIQGKSGSIFYIIASGSVGVYLKRAFIDKKITSLSPGEFFGEMSLISDEPRSASVTCEEDGEVFSLLRDTFREVIMGNPHISQVIKSTAARRQKETHNIELGEAIGRNFR
jgi:CRP-like cAMP-binding protein